MASSCFSCQNFWIKFEHEDLCDVNMISVPLTGIQQAHWFKRQGIWRDMNRKRNQELLSNLRWLNATKRAALYPDPWEKKTRKRLPTEF